MGNGPLQLRRNMCQFLRDYLPESPAGVSEELAAGVMLQGLTAHYLVTSVYAADQTTTAVVHAAAGGVGLLLTQMLKARGATVIGTVSSEEKVARALEAGADHVIRYDEEPWEEKTRELLGDKKVDVVYDGVGQSTFEAGLTVLRPRGLMALYGAASGAVPPFDLQRLNGLGSLVITRPSLGDFVRTPDELACRVGDIFDAVQSGTLSVAIAKTFSLDDAADAHRAIQSRQYSGKILLSVTP
jgi:NADPH:quinone reductase and related Zn-dependent oxidoreductases